jgi:hypothetical protein
VWELGGVAGAAVEIGGEKCLKEWRIWVRAVKKRGAGMVAVIIEPF